MSRAWQVTVLGLLLLAVGSSPAQEPLSSEDRAARVAKAEEEAKQAFAENHYYFMTPQGRVDPAEGGIPSFAVGLKKWTAYRGNRYMSEVKVLRAVGRNEDARRVLRRKILYGGVTAAGAVVSALFAAPDEFWNDSLGAEEPSMLIRGVGVFGGFGVGTYGLIAYQRRYTPLDELFLPIQRLNDQIRENIRAQYRLLHGVPLEGAAPVAPPTPPSPPSSDSPAPETGPEGDNAPQPSSPPEP